MNNPQFQEFSNELALLIIQDDTIENSKYSKLFVKISHQFIPEGVRIFGSRKALLSWCQEPFQGLNDRNAIESLFISEYDEVYGEMIAQADGVYP